MTDESLTSRIDEKSYVGCVVTSRGAVLDSYRLDADGITFPPFRAVYEVALAMYDGREKICYETILSKLGFEYFGATGESVLDICSCYLTNVVSQFFATLCNLLALRRTRSLGMRITDEVGRLPAKSDPAAFCKGVADESANLFPSVHADNKLGEACDAFEKRLDMLARGEKILGFKSPLGAWNEAFGGICDGYLYALAARPGLGKTALMEQMISEYLTYSKPVAVFEKDMSPNMLIERIACRVCKISHWSLSRGAVSKEGLEQLRNCSKELRKTPFFLYNPTGLTPEKMSAITRRDHRVHGIKAVFLDHIQVLDVGREKREGLTHASITIRQTATETNIPHVILAHINRNGAKGRPTPEDIKEFDQLYGDCDGMALLWTDADRTKLDHDEFLPMKVYFAKNRNGPTGEEDALFDGKLMSFHDKVKTKTEPRNYHQ